MSVAAVRGSYRKRSHCKQNHEYTQENTYSVPSGGRRCRACERGYVNAYQRRRRAERINLLAELDILRDIVSSLEEAES